MGFEKRGIDPGAPTSSGTLAENDQHYTEYVYGDLLGTLTYGQPIYKDVTDAAEFNNYAPGAPTALTPVTPRTGGRVVRGSNPNAGANLVCVGIYSPENPGSTATFGTVIRVCDRGVCVASVQSPAGGAAGNVGSAIIASAAVNDAVPGARASGVVIGVILATRAVVAPGAAVVAAASATATLVNAMVMLG